MPVGILLLSHPGIGPATLDAARRALGSLPLAAGAFEVPWEAERVVLLQQIEQTPFFQKVRGDLVVSLYNQKELWPKFGYEGSSAEFGGYITRGFADIDWLPKA